MCRAYINYVRIEAGREDPFDLWTTILSTFRTWCQENNSKLNQQDLSPSDIAEGLTAVISVTLQNADRSTPFNSSIDYSEIGGYVRNLISDKLYAFFIENRPDAIEISRRVELAQLARDASRKAKGLVRRQWLLEQTGLPGSLADCNAAERSKETEIFLVQGACSAGTAKMARDRSFQAVLPVWKRIVDAESTRPSKIFQTDQIQEILRALGLHSTKLSEGEKSRIDGEIAQLDCTRLRYHRIIIVTESNKKGFLLKKQMTGFFNRFAKDILKKGLLFTTPSGLEIESMMPDEFAEHVLRPETRAIQLMAPDEP